MIRLFLQYRRRGYGVMTSLRLARNRVNEGRRIALPVNLEKTQ
jgi:predicted GNAT family acetyltransferase